jgi:hypothetical protein
VQVVTLTPDGLVPMTGGASIGGGFLNACALRTDGSGYCWGDAAWGADGTGSEGPPPTYTYISAVPVLGYPGTNCTSNSQCVVSGVCQSGTCL